MKRQRSNVLVDCRTPRDIKIVQQLVKQYRDGNEIDPNEGIMSIEEYQNLLEQQRNSDKDIIIPPILQPFIIEWANKHGAKLVINAHKKENSDICPSEWDKDLLGEWRPGWSIVEARKSHVSDIRNLVINPNVNLVEINKVSYILGVYNIVPYRRGNKYYNWVCGMRVAHRNTPDMEYLVGQLNVSATVVCGMVFGFPNQVVRWGFICIGDTKLSHDDIRKMLQNKDFNWDSVDFVPLDFEEARNKYCGNFITENELYSVVRKEMSNSNPNKDGRVAWDAFASRHGRSHKSKDTREKIWQNIATMTRQNPDGIYCFGLPNVQVGIALVSQFDEEGKNRVYRFFISQYSTYSLKETAWDARKRIKSTQTDKCHESIAEPDEHEIDINNISSDVTNEQQCRSELEITD